MTAISVSERLLEMAAFYTPLALTVTNLLSFLNQFYHMAFSQSKRFGSKLTVYHGKPVGPLRCSEPAGYCNHSHSTNPIIWGCISYTLTGITFANLLIFYLLFLAANFLSIKIVSQKAGEYNYLLHRFPGYSAIENTLIYRKFSFIALDAFRSGRSRHPWTL